MCRHLNLRGGSAGVRGHADLGVTKSNAAAAPHLFHAALQLRAEQGAADSGIEYLLMLSSPSLASARRVSGRQSQLAANLSARGASWLRGSSAK